MIVFKNKKEKFSTEEWICKIEQCLNSLLGKQNEHDLSVKLTIYCGELECGITDNMCQEEDSINNTVLLFRKMAVLAGKLFLQSWENGSIDIDTVSEFRFTLFSIQVLNIPEFIYFGESEGFAYYGLFPETYVETAKKLAKTFSIKPITIIGLRTIGTTLSAIVSATLTSLGYENASITLRPKGEPFNRTIRVSKELELFLFDRKYGYFIITDEGPGLSGSSFGGTAQFLYDLGVPDKNIIYFPSWEPDSSMMNSQNARNHWNRHAKMSTSFETVWIDSGKLQNKFGAHKLIDISAGMWRGWLMEENSELPPVHPHHERRKYLVTKKNSVNNPTTLIKFAGLGEYGEKTLQRAKILEKSGFTLPVRNYEHGFIEFDFIDTTHRCIKGINKSFLSSAAKYAAFLKDTFPVNDMVSPEEMIEMVKENISECIGDMYFKKLDVFQQYIDKEYLRHGTAIDGRMQLCKWLQYESKFIKTDHTDHHHDQFFPGCQDIAWDIAGGIIEWNLDRENERYFINEYVGQSGDMSITERVYANKIAYCAFRTGISKLFSESLSETPDGLKFVKKYDYYKYYLQNILK